MIAAKHAALYTGRRLPLLVGRTPLLPVETIVNIFAADDPLHELRVFLQREPLVRQALYVASHTLADVIEAWIDGRDENDRKAQLRALAYVSRMAARPTPLGLCAGIGEVALGEQTTLEVAGASRRTHTRPDMGFMAEVAKEIEAGANRADVRYVTNEAALIRGERLYVTNVALISQAPDLDNATEQRPVSLRNTSAVRFVREFARDGQRYEAIVESIAREFSASSTDAEMLLDRLIQAGVLICELRASPVGDPVNYLLERFKALSPRKGGALNAAQARARQLDERPLNARTLEGYREVTRAFSEAQQGFQHANTQVDLCSPFSGSLNARVLDDAARLAEYLVRMAPIKRLERYRQRFEERYEGVERMVPLLELVDSNIGLGLSENLSVTEDNSAQRDAALLTIASEALRNGHEEIVLEGERLEVLVPPLSNESRVPDSLEVGFQIVAQSPEAIDSGDYLVVLSGFVATERAARSLGRFAHLFADGTTERIERLARTGDYGDALPAELNFVPATARAYNVAIRPRLFDTEIQIGVGDSTSADTIPLDDLWVGLDGGRFFLWSAARRRIVLPLESHVFATENNAPNICRFLAALVRDGRRAILGFNWGPAARLTYLPRVRVGNVVLSVRQWRFEAERLRVSRDPGALLRDWRTTWKIPRHVLLGELDAYILIDLESTIALELLRNQVPRDVRYITLREALPNPSSAWVPGETGRHVVEFVASVARSSPKPSNGSIQRSVVLSRQRYGPGSQWLYAKLYVAAQAADDLIVRALLPAIAELRELGALDCWFFVRYRDPQYHLRLRLRSATNRISETREWVVRRVEEWLGSGLVQRYAFDTYDPEYERYSGAKSMEAIERFFCADSDLCAALLAATPDAADERVAAAARSFYPFVIGGDLESCATRTLRPSERRKLEAGDRLAFKQLASELREAAPSGALADAVTPPCSGALLAAVFHLHCNRLALDADAEARAMLLLRSLLVSRHAA